MMAAFFHFQHALNRLFNNWVKLTPPPPQEKLPSKSSALKGLNHEACTGHCDISIVIPSTSTLSDSLILIDPIFRLHSKYHKLNLFWVCL